MSSRYDLYIEQGSTKNFQIQFLNDDETPINLTGYTFSIEIRPTVNSTTVYDTLTSANGRITSTPLEGKILIKFPDTVTTEYTFLTGEACESVYDLEFKIGTTTTRELEGNVTISPEVTRIT